VTTALVLGAGGLTGGAFHAGVLQGLLDGGWDAADADLIVGTSAGSSTGATLRAGIPVTDHYADQTRQPVSAETEARRRGLPPRLDFTEPERPTDLRPLDPALGGRAFLRRGHPRLGLLFGGLQPRGRMDTLRIAARIDGIHAGVPWPEAPLWICSVRVRDGRRRVFGREMSEATVGVAVAASSAVPGLLAPVTVDGAEHVDGAVHSPTNLDLLAGMGYDRIVVSSPMSGSTDWRQPARAYHTRLLHREAEAVRASGTDVVLIEPDTRTLSLMGEDAMAPGAEREVAESARRQGLAAG
jgi:NTE family protein